MNEATNHIILDGKNLSIQQIIQIAESNYTVSIATQSKDKIVAGRRILEKQIQARPDIAIYGTNRLHGDLKHKEVPRDLIAEYQIKYVNVHNCGTGKPLPKHIIRAIMVIRLNSFAKGMSGMKWDTCQIMIDMLNKGVTPWILEEGTVGASGDLVPLSMLSAVVIGLPEAKAYYQGKLYDNSKEALTAAGIAPVVLGAKEAMGLSNGANFITAWSIFSVRDIERLIETTCISAALSLEAIRGEQKAFSRLINEDSDRHEGQVYIAQRMRALLKGSKRTSIDAQIAKFGTRPQRERVQDRYSFRCVPQVHGPTYEAWQKYKSTVECEINATTDNPLFDFDTIDERTGGVMFASGGNFHGQPLATVIDYMKIALTSLGLMSDKRTFSLMDGRFSYGLPDMLAYNTDRADGGLMIAQYAGAARAAENRVLSTPASITSLSTSAGQEDFVSMGSIGVLHLQKIIYNLQTLAGIELLCAHRAIQLTAEWLPKELRHLGEGTQKVHDFLSKSENLPQGSETDKDFYLKDHYLRLDMEKAIALVASGAVVACI
jgi:histidine ammonia-lyase